MGASFVVDTCYLQSIMSYPAGTLRLNIRVHPSPPVISQVATERIPRVLVTRQQLNLRQVNRAITIQHRVRRFLTVRRIERNSSARQIQRVWRLWRGSYTEMDRRIAGVCLRQIADLNWLYYDSGSYEGPEKERYSQQTAAILDNYAPCNDAWAVAHITGKQSSYCYRGFYKHLKLLREELESEEVTSRLETLKATCYLGRTWLDLDN